MDYSYMTTLNLSPTHVYVVENSSETLTCSKENGNLVETRWANSKFENQLANLYISPNDGSCVSSNFLLQNRLFTGVCGDGVYSVKLNRIDRTQHGAEWQCTEYLTTSNKVVINVSVPASGVTLSQPSGEYMKENQTIKIKCNTSACRPDPRVQWYLRKSTGEVVKNLTQFSTGIYDRREYGLVTVESILNFTPNRTVNYMSLFCEVWTRSKDKADIVSREVIITVAYC
ncbi:uncharacterized protein LOC132753364 [Ruditapes philippinarum]|uniref:uncharacterized protein LOC132753364 n=1 Tax=Ruditapes philippinarum TaxID=129788 RepID=UPI00295BD501|nr:uncharacterized protein LOC132753364 [Ruditapes philippinarum]